MPEISIKKLSESKVDHLFEVIVKEDESSSKHEVRLTKEFYDILETEASPEIVVRKSFEFLLEREPKESILSKFDLKVISKYFPEYDDKVKEF